MTTAQKIIQMCIDLEIEQLVENEEYEDAQSIKEDIESI